MICIDSDQIIGTLLLATSLVLVYLLIDMAIQGPFCRLFTRIINYWYDTCYWPDNQLKSNNYKQQLTGTVNSMYNYNRSGYHRSRIIDVWVNKFIDRNNPSRGRVLIKESCFTESEDLYEWKWIASKGDYGWYEKDPPLPKPKPSVYISEGARDEVDRILSEYAASKNPEATVENEEKETKSTNMV